MIAGRSGSGKSAFALWLAVQWNLPTLYLSADMNGFQASTRVAAMLTAHPVEEIERRMGAEGTAEEKQQILNALAKVNMTFSFHAPITFANMYDEIGAYVELHDRYPELIVVDNLMDIEGCESDYTEQQAAMQEIAKINRGTGANFLILHHATDKSSRAEADPFSPPSRGEVKSGLSEKPRLSLSVALNPNNSQFRVAIIKQTNGYSDPSAANYDTLISMPETTRFHPYRVEPAFTTL